MQNDPDYIRHEINEIQARMKARADSLSDQFSPNNLVTEGINRVFSDPANSIDRLQETVRQHPIASAMVAAGMASVAGAFTREQINGSPQAEKARRTMKTNIEKAKTRTATIAKSAKDRLDSVSEQVGQGYEDAAQTARETGREAAHVAGNAADTISRKGNALTDDARRFARENPVALGLFAVGAGALAASFFTARRPSEEPADAKPRVGQAKKSTRAKSSPNKTVKRMKPATGTTKAGAKKSAGKTRAGKGTTTTSTAAKRAAKGSTSSGKA